MTNQKTRRISGQMPAPATLSQKPLGVILPEAMLEFSQSHEARPTIVFRSERLGEGNPVLGDHLTGEFLQALLKHPEPPQAMLFYNSAVHLVMADSLVLDALRQLAERGCEILACRTSLQILLPDRQPAVGRTASFAELTDRMRQAQLLLWP